MSFLSEKNPFQFPIVGLDISDESFKYVFLQERKGIRQIGSFGERPLHTGIIEAGEVKDQTKLAEALKSAFTAEKALLKNRYVVLSLPEEKGFLRLIKIPRVAPREIRQAIEFQLEEHIPYPPADLVFDFSLLNTKGDQMEVVVTAYPKETVEAYMSTLRMAGLLPVVFELESQAVARAAVPASFAGAVLVGDIGKTRTTFSIVFQGQVYFTSTIKIGGRDVDKILMDSLHITAEEAVNIKMGRGFDLNSEEIIKSLSPAITALKDEADRQVGFWERRYPEKEGVSCVYLCGGDALLRGLPEFLALELRMPVERARIGENLFDLDRYIPSIEARGTMRYATALGLAIRGGDIFKE